ncbi:hypothetical protein AB0I82_05920 [Streptomyces sp. NPDC050315]|uniref:hypothetical protein n=1 Tax=Streptomyces sp. NPDC050315 TaxID=3155039 RepID=UPI0034213DE9
MDVSETGSTLPAQTRAQLVEHLRAGHTPDEAATRADIPLDALHAAATTDGDLAVALAGRDPFAPGEQVIQQRADVLRGVATGMTLADAARVAGVPISSVAGWRARDEQFRAALDAVRAMADDYAIRPGTRMTPARVETLLAALREGETMARAATRAGVSPTTVYQRKARDAEFAEQFKEAKQAGLNARARRRGKQPSLRTAHYRLVRVVTDDTDERGERDKRDETDGKNDPAR